MSDPDTTGADTTGADPERGSLRRRAETGEMTSPADWPHNNEDEQTLV